jgi:hypothetical protein
MSAFDPKRTLASLKSRNGNYGILAACGSRRHNTANMTKLFVAVGTVSGNPIFKLSAPGACSCSVVEKQTDFTPTLDLILLFRDRSLFR